MVECLTLILVMHHQKLSKLINHNVNNGISLALIILYHLRMADQSFISLPKFTTKGLCSLASYCTTHSTKTSFLEMYFEVERLAVVELASIEPCCFNITSA